MPDDHGMLFVFPEEVEQSFWMKNTLIPLDMLFIARRRTDRRHPRRRRAAHHHGSCRWAKPSRYVLEVNGGWAARHGVRAGDRVELRGVPGAP